MNSTDSLPWYRVPTAWLVFSLPLVSVIVGFVMLGFAIASYDGLVVDDYYRRGKEINLDLARDRLAAAQKMSASLQWGAREVSVDLRSTSALPAQLELQLLYATREGHDARLPLMRTDGNRYRATLAELPPGRYYVQIAAEGWRLLGSITVPGERRVELISQTD
jgi:hypothetical protein